MSLSILQRRLKIFTLIMSSGCGVAGPIDDDLDESGSSEELTAVKSYYPAADTFVDEASPNATAGAARFLSVRGGDGQRRNAFLRFSFVPPAGKVVLDAKLVLRNGGRTTPSSNAGGSIRLFTPERDDWTEDTSYSWANRLRGDAGTEILSSIGAVVFRGTSAFPNLQSTIPTGDGSTAKSVTYLLESGGSDDASFYSRNNAVTWVRPRLRVVWGNEVDLMIRSFSARVSNGSLTIQYGVRNTGDRLSSPVAIHFYASSLGAASRENLLCSDTVPPLAGRHSYPASGVKQVVCSIPDAWVAPAITAWVDPTNAVAEANESNNQWEAKTVIGPDLVSLGPPTFSIQNGVVSISAPAIKNVGSRTAAASRIGFFLSDVFVCDAPVPALPPGARFPLRGNLALTCTAPALGGAHKPMSRVDLNSRVAEGNETNNELFATPLQVHTRGDGWHRISVALPLGETDEMWIYAASANAAIGSNRPVVVFGHGQGLHTIANCSPDGQPVSPVVQPAIAFVEALAAEGFLGVAVFYRNVGLGSPTTGGIKMRDGHIFDARAFLAAAQWAQKEHGAGSDSVALVGSSFGVNAALWAVSNHPLVNELQSGLRIKTIALGGHTGNSLASSRLKTLVTSPSPDDRAVGFFLASAIVAGTAASSDGVAVLTSSNVMGPQGRYLTNRGQALVIQTMISAADQRKASCAGLTLVPLCKTACLSATYESIVAPVRDPGQLQDWVSPEAAQAVLYDSSRGDPGPNTPNRVLQMIRQLSPALAAQGPARTPRALLLLSEEDDEVLPQQPQGPASLKAKLDELQVAWTAPAIRADSVGTCEHDTYFERYRNCGYRELLSELKTAMSK